MLVKGDTGVNKYLHKRIAQGHIKQTCIPQMCSCYNRTLIGISMPDRNHYISYQPYIGAVS